MIEQFLPSVDQLFDAGGVYNRSTPGTSSKE